MKILNVVSTPFELYYLSSVASLLLEKDKKLRIELLIRKELEEKITPGIKSLYSTIKITEFPTLSFPLSRNPIKTFRNLLENISQTIKFKNYLKAVMSDVDVLCISSFREFFANIICKQAPSNIRLVALRMANQKVEKLGSFKKRPILSFFSNFKNFFFGFSFMEYKWRTDFKDIVEKSFIKYPYHRTISITDYNIGRTNSNYRLPPPFVALRKVYKQASENGKVAILVAGERTPPFTDWNETAQKKYEDFFNYLRENFKNYKLYFKPRKNLTDTSKSDLRNFHIIEADASFEEICLKENISKVISIKSTASKVGVYSGITSYLLYPIFDLSIKFKSVIESYFEDMQSIIRVNKLEDLKKEPNSEVQKYNFEDLTSLYWEAIVK